MEKLKNLWNEENTIAEIKNHENAEKVDRENKTSEIAEDGKATKEGVIKYQDDGKLE